MSCGGSHLGFPIGIKNRNFVEDLPMIIPGQFGFNSDRKSKMAATAGHRLTLDPMGKYSNAFFSETTNIIKAKLYMNVHWMVLGHLEFSIGIKKQKLCRGPSNDHSWTVWYQLSKWFQRRSVLKHLPIGLAATAGLSLTWDPMGKMFQDASSLKPLGQLKPNCPGMIIGRSSTNFLFFYANRKFKMAEDHPMNIHVQFGFNHI
jgi:hypothetical protein